MTLTFSNNPLIQKGVLFSLETTVAYYPLKTYYYAFLTSTMAGIYYTWMIDTTIILPTTILVNNWVYLELPFFLLLGMNVFLDLTFTKFILFKGIVIGVLSAAYVKLIVIIQKSRYWFASRQTSIKLLNTVIYILSQ